ncbi:MAG: single-stranded-DNA-specific exonuclease RecJ [Clostridia bacterium]
MKRWEIAKTDKVLAKEMAEKYGISNFTAFILLSKGVTSDEDLVNLLGDIEFQESPFDIIDMDIAVDRIHEAIDKFERIAIYGDYDADGVTATSILYKYLESLEANVMFYIPKRIGEGYGMHKQGIDFLHEQEVDLIITVDNGIAAIDVIDYANEQGIDVIVTDHHQPKETLPNALAIIDAHRKDCTSEFKDLCGAGVALKLVMALEWDDGDPDQAFLDYVDLAAIGTVADVMPLKGENRVIVQKGLESLNQSNRSGVKALLSKVNLNRVTSKDIGYVIGPRINAAGRMGSADGAVKLLIEDNYQDCLSYAELVCSENDRRKTVENQIVKTATQMIESDDKLKYARVLVVGGHDWHPGVVGLVAGTLVKIYQKPAIVITFDDDGNGRGSCRGLGDFSILDCLNASSQCLDHYGGHPMAAGLGIHKDNLAKFIEDVEIYAKKNFNIMPNPVLNITCKLKLQGLSLNLLNEIEILEPFGAGNESPIFALLELKLTKITLSKDGKHSRLTFTKGNERLEIMKFSCENFEYEVGSILDIVVSLGINNYMGVDSLKCYILDIKLSKLNQEEELYSYSLYEKLRRKEGLSKYEQALITPVRDDIATIYRIIRNKKGWDKSIYQLLEEVQSKSKINLAKLLISLDALEETKLIKVENADICNIKILPTTSKVDIMATDILTTLAGLLKE